ncbi:MAG: CRISPR-associated protein Cas4 [Methanocellales archaeon]|nr:CRISPR-associated protein Cas4 [Methanocellales archaeon]
MRDSTNAGKPILNVFDLSQYYYCPRKVYFLTVMGVPATPRKKMSYGKKEQEKERKRVTERKDVFGIPRDEVEEVLHKVYVEDRKIGLIGQVDTVLKLKNGTILPVDVKYTNFVRVYRNWKKQLTAYALLLSSEFGCDVNEGILYFPKQKEHVRVDISKEDKDFVLMDLEKLRGLMASEHIPRKTDEKKCRYCEVARYCV